MFADKQIKSNAHINKNTIRVNTNFLMVERFDEFVHSSQKLVEEIKSQPHIPWLQSLLPGVEQTLEDNKEAVLRYVRQIDTILLHLDEDYVKKIEPIIDANEERYQATRSKPKTP